MHHTRNCLHRIFHACNDIYADASFLTCLSGMFFHFKVK